MSEQPDLFTPIRWPVARAHLTIGQADDVPAYVQEAIDASVKRGAAARAGRTDAA